MWFCKRNRLKELEQENGELKERNARLEQMVQDREQYVMKTARELEEYRRQYPPDEAEARRQAKMRKDWDELLGYTGKGAKYEAEA